MGALEEAHLAAAVAAACACEEDDDDLELLGGEAEPAAAAADAMEPAVRALLAGLGEDERREGLRRTPKRVAKAFRDGTRGTAASPFSSVGPLPWLRGSARNRACVLCKKKWRPLRSEITLVAMLAVADSSPASHATAESYDVGKNNAVSHLNTYGFVWISQALRWTWDYSLGNSIAGGSRVHT
jgi:GTP cyclohydrolase I